MADTDPPETTPASTPAKPARRRSTTPAKARAAKPSAPKAEAAKPTAAKAKAPPKPRTTKRAAAKPAASARKPATRAKSSSKAASDKAGVPWSKTVIGAGIAVAGGVAAAALLSLRGSSAKTKPVASKGKSHQADGTDSSDQFDAGIADEGMVPE